MKSDCRKYFIFLIIYWEKFLIKYFSNYQFYNKSFSFSFNCPFYSKSVQSYINLNYMAASQLDDLVAPRRASRPNRSRARTHFSPGWRPCSSGTWGVRPFHSEWSTSSTWWDRCSGAADSPPQMTACSQAHRYQCIAQAQSRPSRGTRPRPIGDLIWANGKHLVSVMAMDGWSYLKVALWIMSLSDGNCRCLACGPAAFILSLSGALRVQFIVLCWSTYLYVHSIVHSHISQVP